MTLSAGTRFGSYEIVAPLGAGGMGEVYRATDTRLGREVAIKVLPTELARDAERLTRFTREAQLLAALNHPNIAAIHGIEEADGQTFLVLELVEGEDLAARLQGGALPVEEAAEIARQIAEALEEAHAKGIVHRDLKPGNIKLTPDGRVKVLDFGLAKAYDSDAGSGASSDLSHSPTLARPGTMAGVILGTAGYMSPEQARGKPVDRRSDTWALGAVLFEMLTGARAFQGETVSDTLAAVLTREPPWATLPSATPAPLRRLLHRCLQKDRKLRLDSAADARLEIDEASRPAAEDEPAQAGTRRPWAVVAALAGVVVGAVVARIALHPPPAEPARIEIVTYSGTDAGAAASPDGKTIAFTSSRDGSRRIWLKQLDGSGEIARTAGPFDVSPAFSTDGATLLFGRREAAGTLTLLRAPVLGGEERRVVSGVVGGDWSPDGSTVAFATQADAAGTLGTVRADGSGRRELRRFKDEQPIAVAWSPDGRWLACRLQPLTGSVAGRLVLVPLAGGEVRALHNPASAQIVSGLAWSGSGALVYAVRQGSQANAQAGAGRVVSHDVDTDQVRTLFWTPRPASAVVVAAPGTIVLDEVDRFQNLRAASLPPGSGAAALTWLTRGSSQDRQPAYSPDGKWVIFSSNRSGNLDLWAVSRRDGQVRRITDDVARDWDPAFTSDGAGILWSSERGGHLEIWTAAADGSGARQISQDGVDAENPTMTNDGQWVVYASGHPDKRGIWRVHPDGRGTSPIARGALTLPEVSPDGRLVAYLDLGAEVAFQRTLRVRRIADGGDVAFAIGIARNGSPDLNFGRVRWMPGGRALAFLAADADGVHGVFVQDFAPGRDTGATRRRLTGFLPDARTESFGIAPDGSEIVISAVEQRSAVLLARGIPDLLPANRGRK